MAFCLLTVDFGTISDASLCVLYAENAVFTRKINNFLYFTIENALAV